MDAATSALRAGVAAALEAGLREILEAARTTQPEEIQRATQHAVSLQTRLTAAIARATAVEGELAGRGNVSSQELAQLRIDLAQAQLRAHKAKDEAEDLNKNLVAKLASVTAEKAADLATERALAKYDKAKLTAELDAQKTLVSKLEARPAAKPLPADQGNAGEAEIESLLTRCFYEIMEVRNVSKGGQGHAMDLEVAARVGDFRLRIDVKNAQRVPEDEIAKFYRDIDGLKPAAHAAILFIRCGLTSPGPSAHEKHTLSKIESKRGATVVVHIGGWNTRLLVQCIYDLFIDHEIRSRQKQEATRPAQLAGGREVAKGMRSLCELVGDNNDAATRAFLAVSDWKHTSAETARETAHDLRAAHAANPRVITREQLAEYERRLPKRQRGGRRKTTNPSVKNTAKPAAKRGAKRKTAASSESTSSGLDSSSDESSDNAPPPRSRPKPPTKRSA